MILKGGSRHLILRNATDLTFEATPTAKVNLHPSIDPRNPRITDIWVDGISEGSCIRRAKNRLGAIMGLINLEVVAPRIVKTAFYRLVDSKRSGSSTLDDNTVKQLDERLVVVWDQTSCMMEALPTSAATSCATFRRSAVGPKTAPSISSRMTCRCLSASIWRAAPRSRVLRVGSCRLKGKSTNGVTKGIRP